MIKINPISNVAFERHKQDKKSEPKYSDPLMKWPIRGLGYTNELGAALSEITPKLGTLLWFPAIFYFGADIYDKYKNEKTSYNPDPQRGTKQAIFQALASVIMPTGAVILGQKTASALGAFGKTGLTLQTQEDVTKFIQAFADRRHLEKFVDKKQEFKDHFLESLTTKHSKIVREHKFNNPIQMVAKIIATRRNPKKMHETQADRVRNFASENIDRMFKIYEELVSNNKPKEFSKKMWKKFIKLKVKLASDPDYKETFVKDAAEDMIKKYQKNRIMGAKMLKTVGGFVALGLAIKPIDRFVENVILKKVVEPNLQTMFAKKEVEEYKQKALS